MNVEYSLGPFVNWFIPSCLDIWSSNDGKQVLCSYGARSLLCLLEVTHQKSFKVYNSLNIFNHKSIVSVTRFDKTGPKSLKTPILFLGSSDGEAAIINCFNSDIVYQKNKIEGLDLPSKKILSADWTQNEDNNPIVYYSMHSVIICWNITTNEINCLKIGENYDNKIAISCIACSKSGDKKLSVGYMNGDITIVYLDNLLSMNAEQTLSGHNDDICSLAFSWNSGHYEEGLLASVSRDGFVKVWDIAYKNNIADNKLDANKSHHKNWFALSFVPNNKLNEKFQLLIGCGNGDILSLEVPNKRPDSKIRVHKPISYLKNRNICHNSVIFTIAVDVKTMFAITSSLDHQMILWDLLEKKAIDCFNTFSYGVHDISVSPIDPSRIAVAIGETSYIMKFDESLKVSHRRIKFDKMLRNSKCLSIVWHPECENRLAFGTSLGVITVIDNLSQKKIKYTKCVDSSKVYGLVWGPSLEGNDESTLYSVHSNGKVYVHYISSDFFREFTHYSNDDIKRSEIMWKTNFKHLSVGNDDGTVDIFQYKTNELKLKLRIKSFKRPILSLRWNSIKDEETSNWLAVSSYQGDIHCYSLYNFLVDNDYSTEESSLQAIDKPNRVLRGHSDRVTSMSWCPFDSNKLVSVSYDNTALVWDVLNESPIFKFSGHRSLIYSVLWSLTDPDLIYSGGEDNFFHAWRPSQQNNLNSNQKSKSESWPHLEMGEPSDETVSKVLNKCINEVVLNQMIETNGFGVEEEIKAQKSLRIRNKPIKRKVNKEFKRISLFPLSNSIENSSTTYQKLEDIEAIFEKLSGKELSEERCDRILLYGNSDDLKTFVRNEISNHLKHGNKEQNDVLSLLLDIKTTIEDSIERKETNPLLVSLSISVSRNHWKESAIILANQLIDSEAEILNYNFYKTEMSAILLLSQNKFKESIDLLISNKLFREALIVSKTRLNSEEMNEFIFKEWAKHRKQNNDLEGSAKCLTAIRRFDETIDLLRTKNDQQFDRTISLLRSSVKQIM